MTVLLEKARRATGFDDVGDPAFLDSLELWLSSCRATGRLNRAGTTVLGKVVVRHLVNRLQLAHHLGTHPEVTSRPLRVSVVVTGLPRTGTTLLHNLLSLDPHARALRLWEALHPVPPEDEGRSSEAALIDQAEAWLDAFHRMAPAMRSIHPARAQGPEECDTLLQNEFTSQHFDDMFDAQRYSSWLASADLGAQYSYYALQLRALTYADAGDTDRHWVLKSPSHLGHLGSLAGVLPGALIVHCHRAPAEAIASWASLVQAVRSPGSDHLDPAAIGRQCLHRAVVATRRAREARQRLGEEGFVDVGYPSLVADPVATVADIYQRSGRSLGPTMEARMRTWLAENRQHRHGVHRYTLAQFGLAPEQVDEELGAYTGRLAAIVEPRNR